MAWAEKLSGGGWRGCWRVGEKKYYTNSTTHPLHPYRLKSDAKDAANEAEVKAKRRAAVDTGTLSAKTKWSAWWDLIAEDRANAPSDNHLTELYIVRDYLIPRWGDTELIGIKHKTVQKWVDSLADGSCPEWKRDRRPEASYVHRIVAPFMMSLKKAVDEGVLDANPCAGISKPRIHRKRKLHLTVDEAAQIGMKLRADYRDAVDCLLETGLRPSELCGLHADRIDWVNMLVEVDTVHVYRKKLMRGWPKDKDTRKVPLTATAAEILRRRLAGRDLTAGCGVEHSPLSECRSVLVFLTERGRPMSAQQIGNVMRYAAQAHQVPKRTPYSGRRGFATRAARGGADAFAIAEVMGHSDVELTRGYVQDERLGPVIRAALGDREPLRAVEGGQGEEPEPPAEEQREAR